MASKQAGTDWREIRRFRALELKRDGWTHDEVAEALAVSKTAVSKWMKIADQQGEEGLIASPRKGAKPRLTIAHLQQLPALLKAGAAQYGFRGEVWTCERVAHLIQQEFHVRYHKAHVSRLLKALDWTPQKPLERAAQRDEAAILRWRTEVWPALKKKRAAKDGSLFVWMRRGFTCCLVWCAPTLLVERHQFSRSFRHTSTCR